MAPRTTEPRGEVLPAGDGLAENSHDYDELRVLRRAAQRDPAAVRALYRLFVHAVHRHVARILGAGDPDVDDVVQEVFLAVLDGAHAFRGTSRVSSWVHGIATRRALDHARARWRRGRWRRIGEVVGISRPPARPDDAHHTSDSSERLLSVLTPEQRAVFMLKEVEGYTFAEIETMTGIGISTLHARLAAARRRLDERLNDDGERESLT